MGISPCHTLYIFRDYIMTCTFFYEVILHRNLYVYLYGYTIVLHSRYVGVIKPLCKSKFNITIIKFSIQPSWHISLTITYTFMRGRSGVIWRFRHSYFNVRVDKISRNLYPSPKLNQISSFSMTAIVLTNVVSKCHFHIINLDSSNECRPLCELVKSSIIDRTTHSIFTINAL